MYKRVLSILIVLTISGCVSSGTGEISSISSVEKNIKTEQYLTKDSVKSKYGEPNSIFKKDGKEVYEYKYIRVQNSVLGYVPIVGMWFGRTYKTNYLYTYFDENGNLVDFDTVSIQGEYPIK